MHLSLRINMNKAHIRVPSQDGKPLLMHKRPYGYNFTASYKC